MLRDFLDFLKEYRVVSLAIAFIMGSASTSLVNSLVKDVLMPILSSFTGSDSWREAYFELGSARIIYGSFLAEFINFLILALIVFLVTKKLLKMDADLKK